MSSNEPEVSKDEVWVSPNAVNKKKPWYKSKTAIIIGAILLLSGIGNAMNGQSQTAAPVASESSDVMTQAVDDATPEPTETQEETAMPEETPAAAVETFSMPKVVGMNLQDAQDLLQSLGSYLMDQRDATGQGRLQLLDRNWTVCSQEPAPGTKTDISEIVTLSSVKLDEYCP